MCVEEELALWVLQVMGGPKIPPSPIPHPQNPMPS